MAFLLKKVVGGVLMPLPSILIVAAVGAWLWTRGGRPRWGKALVSGAVVLLLAASCSPLARFAARPLEWAYPAFPGDSVDAVVVLASGHRSDPELPLTARLQGQSLYRVTEGVRIAVAQPWAELVFSGFGGPDPVPHAEVARAMAIALGIDSTRIHADPRPRDTGEEARVFAPRLAGRRFALVTSATHMPRAVALFRAQGLDPIPAPTGHLTGRGGGGWIWQDLLPREDALTVTRQAWYELLGRTWAVLSGGR